jgi:hypothetical protein
LTRKFPSSWRVRLARMRSWPCGLFLAFLLLAYPTSSTRATTWIKPQRSLSSDQWLEYDVSGADAVGIGQVLAVTDTIADFNPTDGTGIPVRSLTLRATRWIKGNPGKTTIRAGTSPLDEDPVHVPNEPLDRIRSSGRSVLFLLRLTQDGWVLCDGPDPEGAGLRLIPQGQTTALAHKLRRIVASQSPDSLLLHADLVVLGRRSTVQPCRSQAQCASVTIDSVLAGKTDADSILVLTALLGDVPSGPGLYILRQNPDRTYETLGSQAGSQIVENGRARVWGLSITAVRQRLERLRRAPGR